ncbi:MAG: PIN domain-containing protein [Terriglobales bacterium]
MLLVDYENLGKIELGLIPAGVRVPFFFGASQKTVPTDFLRAALKLGERFVPIDIEGQGKNALDFHIAFYMGEFLAKAPASRCIVLSRDKGFDPLIKHLAGRGFAVRRATGLAEAFPERKTLPEKTSPKAASQWQDAWNWLVSLERNRRPRKLKGLVAHLHSRFSKNATEADARAMVERMIAEKKISETDGSITYHA